MESIDSSKVGNSDGFTSFYAGNSNNLKGIASNGVKGHFKVDPGVNQRFPADCEAIQPATVSRNTRPVWVASYPGSGAELFRELVSTITGFPTIDGTVKGMCESNNVITCKTHWPVMNTQEFQDPLEPDGTSTFSWWQKMKLWKKKKKEQPSQREQHRQQVVPPSVPKTFSNQSILLIRNPRHAIPSWYNQIWEVRTNTQCHSRQAPEKSWKRWSRSQRWYGNHTITFPDRIWKWKELIEYWLSSPYYHVALIVPYEQLVAPSTGPALSQQVRSVIARESETTTKSSHHVASNDEDIPCLWHRAVRVRPSKKRSYHQYVPTYTTRQKDLMVAMLDEFIEQQQQKQEQQQADNLVDTNNHTSSQRRQLLELLQQYRHDILNNMPIDDD